MIAALLVLALLGGTPQEGPHAQAMRALESKDYGAAWSLLEAEPDDYLRASGRTYVLYGAGDFAQTVDQAQAALELGGEDLNLLFRASWSAVSLGDLGRSEDFVGRLVAALQSQALPEEHQAFWDDTLAQLEGRVAELELAAEQRADALQRARLVSLSSLLGVLLLIGWLGQR